MMSWLYRGLAFLILSMGHDTPLTDKRVLLIGALLLLGEIASCREAYREKATGQ